MSAAATAAWPLKRWTGWDFPTAFSADAAAATVQGLNNMGYLLQAMGDLAGTRPYYERALAIWEEVLGPDHLDTRIAQGNLKSLG